MLTVYAAGVDISTSVSPEGFAVTEQMNNRRNTCNFTTIKTKVAQGQSIYAYATLDLVKGSNSGTAVLFVQDTFSDAGKYRVNDQIILDIKGTNEAKYTIQAIDNTLKTITLTTNLSFNVLTTTKIGVLLFAGVVVNSPEAEIGVSGFFEYAVQCVDWAVLYDRKDVVQQYVSQYSREMCGRIVYEFCAPDTQVDIDFFESAWTATGVALTMANDATDRIQGLYSQKTGTSGAGAALWTKTFTALDLSAQKHARFWWKASAGYGGMVTALKLRLGADASNYFEYTLANIGAAYEDCWNYESVILSSYASKTGSPNLNAIAWAQIALTCSAAIPTNNLRFDHLLATTGSFTLQKCQRGGAKFGDIRSQYTKPSALTEQFAKNQTYFWYIDNDRDLNFFPSSNNPAPYSLSNAAGAATNNYIDLVIDTDISKLVNRQTVRGGLAPDSNLYTQTLAFDGQRTSFPLDYPPSTFALTVGGVAQTVGAEGYTDETTVQWVYNFSNKLCRKTAATATPTNGTAGVATYYPYKPIRVRATNPASITTMKALTGGDGIYDGPVINDPSIPSFADARTRALAEVNQWGNAIQTATWKTDQDGLHAGMTISIRDDSRGVNGSFLIQKVDVKQKFGARFTYSVTAGSTMFGLIEFFQLLFKKTQQINLDPNEIIDAVLNVDDTITIVDSIVGHNRSKTATAALKFVKTMDFTDIQANPSTAATGLVGVMTAFTNWYAQFIGGETGTVSFPAGNDNVELRVVATTGGSGLEAKARTIFNIPVSPGTTYTITGWYQILAALTNVGTGGGARMRVLEFANQLDTTALVTNTVFSGKTAKTDFSAQALTFTTGGSTNYIGIEFSVYQAAGTAMLSDIVITSSVTESQTVPGIASFCEAT